MVNREVGALITASIMLLLGFAYPITSILGNQELNNSEIFFKFSLFSIILGLSLFGTLAIFYTRKIWNKDNKYGDSFGFYGVGKKPSLKIFDNFTKIQLVMALMIFFGTIFLSTTILQGRGILSTNTFTSSITLPQQFSNLDIIWFSNLLIPIAEESLNIFIMGMLVLSLVLLAVKYKLTVKGFLVYYFGLIPIIIGGLAWIWHRSVYAGSDLAGYVVFLFWYMKAILIQLTGFVFTGIIMHFNNNFWLDFPKLFTSDIALIISIMSIISLSILYLYLYKDNLFGQGKKNKEILV